MNIQFVETTVFTKRIVRMGLEAELRALQIELLRHPGAGATDPGTGGLRKIRMPDGGRSRGKSGGARVHYVHLAAQSLVYLMFVYRKKELVKLSPAQKRDLKRVTDAIKAEWRAR